MITDIEDYFSKGCGRCERFATADCSAKRWEDGLKDLRRICLNEGLIETVKWGHPCYRHGNRNIAILGAFRGDFRMSFFDAALLKDPENILERQGPNTAHPDMIRFETRTQVTEREPIIRSYLKEAMGYAEAGIKPPKEKSEIKVPDELLDAFKTDPELSDAFHNLTPGRRKSYVINLNAAKRSETRYARIAKFRDKIISGKGATER